MRHTLFRALLFLVLVVAAAMGGSLAMRAQQSATPPDVLSALLVEVRGLRTAMEAMATAGPRVQLVLGRVQLQEQRIINQIRRHDAVTASLALARKQLEAMTERVKNVSESLDAPLVDAETRRGRANELADAKTEWARVNADVQRLLTEETILAQDVAAEQNRWADFNQRLEDLERALGRR
jgi:hypothetical protein